MAATTLLFVLYLALSATIIECNNNNNHHELSLQEIATIVKRYKFTTNTTIITDTPESTQLIIKAINNIPDYVQQAMEESPVNCSGAWALLSKATELIQLSAIANVSVSKSMIAIDACGKPQPEILHGNFQFKGGFDECMTINTSSYGFSMQYSQLGIIFVVIYKNNLPKIIPIQFYEALCIPDTCSIRDLNATFTTINAEILSIPTIEPKVLMFLTGLDVQAVQDELPLKYSAGAIIMLLISSLFILLVILGTLYDILLPYYNSFFDEKLIPTSINDMSVEKVTSERDPLIGKDTTRTNMKMFRLKIFLHDIIQSFSLYKNVPAILSTSQPPSAITCINGIRVISMFWVILGHSFIFLLFSSQYKNVIDLYINVASRFSAQAVVNAYFSVDSFFFLSGLLVAYLTFREMSRKNGRFPFISFYIHRFLRLTPTYMFVLFFYWFLAVHIAEGPEMLAIFGQDSPDIEYCRKYWWTNLLYINNFYPTDFGKQCMGWAWYLANDMQFYVISPLLLIPLFYSLPSGLIATCITLISSIGVTGFIAGYYGYPANRLYPTISGKDVPNPKLPTMHMEIYGKPYCRIMPYIVGILLGYFLYKKYSMPFSRVINILVYAIIWMVAIFTGIINVYGLYSSFHGHELSAAENIIYFMFSRFTWGMTLFLVVFACHNGYGGVINRFLSMPMWIPLSRLTFNAYLVHEVVLLIIGGSMRDGIYYTDIGITINIISNTVIAFGAAGLISIFVEFPLSNVERAVFKLFGQQLRATARTGGVDK